jgi:hypothetical protein
MKDEEGASLILVIIFVLIFSIVIAAILDFATTGFKTTQEVIGIRSQQHAVDGAMDGAINAIRGSSTIGLENSPIDCPDFNYESPDGKDVLVTCEAVSAAGGGDPIDTYPQYAVLTGLWGPSASQCDGFLQSGGGVGVEKRMLVNGGIFSNGRLAVNTFEDDAGDVDGCDPNLVSGRSYMSVFGDAFAVGKCTWWKTGNSDTTRKIVLHGGTLGCANRGTPPPPMPDMPAYEPNANTAAGVASLAATAYGGNASNYYDPLPNCSPSQDVDVAFKPGVYTELPKYHVEEAGCSGNVWWFQPGTYYFDFPSTDAEWAVNAGDVVIGGTLRNPSNVSLPDACDPTASTTTDSDDGAPNPGVQFIFGGSSRLTTQSSVGNNGIVDLCAGEPPTPVSDTTKQRIAVYALQPHTVAPTYATRPAAVSPENFETATDPTGSFTQPGEAKSPGGGHAFQDFTASGSNTGSLTFSNFADIQPGSTITSVEAVVRHAEDDAANGLDESITLHYLSDDSNTGAGQTLAMGSSDCTSAVVSGFTEETCDLDFLDDHFTWRDINSLTATYDVDASALKSNKVCNPPTGPDRVCVDVDETAQARLDSIVIKVGYQVPGFEKQDSGSDPFLETSNNPITLFKGTFFAPYADLIVDVHASGTTEFKRGVIASSIRGSVSSSSTQTTAPFSLPLANGNRVVLFEAFVDGKPRLRAKVSYNDADVPGKTLQVLSWAVVRG